SSALPTNAPMSEAYGETSETNIRGSSPMIRGATTPRFGWRTTYDPKEERMIETYRMLGREHEADLAREAERRRDASLVRRDVGRRRFPPIPRLTALRRLVAARPPPVPPPAQAPTSLSPSREPLSGRPPPARVR